MKFSCWRIGESHTLDSFTLDSNLIFHRKEFVHKVMDPSHKPSISYRSGFLSIHKFLSLHRHQLSINFLFSFSFWNPSTSHLPMLVSFLSLQESTWSTSAWKLRNLITSRRFIFSTFSSTVFLEFSIFSSRFSQRVGFYIIHECSLVAGLAG